ncbi:MAG: aminoglycoside phosphotransferase family protein [Bacteroidia bacterium]|nr:aminoglycoside phosphotransferase family protein [Bacteroidia bacterium]
MSPGAAAELMEAFWLYGDVQSVRPIGSGHIHGTWAVEMDQAGVSVRYILQQVNTQVFQDPDMLARNLTTVLDWQQHQYRAAGTANMSRRCLTLIHTRRGGTYHTDAAGFVWRVFLLIEHTYTLDRADTPAQAYAAARAFGQFGASLAELPPDRLGLTLPGFHDLSLRIAQLRTAAAGAGAERQVAAARALEQARYWEQRATAWIEAAEALPWRICHNDTKINNVLLDRTTGEGVCVIDLDTVMPGRLLYDFGDLVRTAAPTADEDATELDTLHVRAEICEALYRGFVADTQAMMTQAEQESLVLGPYWMACIMAFRFLADFLRGDTYYKVRHSRHNLDRALNQFRILECLDQMDIAGTLSRSTA